MGESVSGGGCKWGRVRVGECEGEGVNGGGCEWGRV